MGHRAAATALGVLIVSVGVAGVCPFGCSGHGTCSTPDVCSCFSGYTGFACSQRFCPTGPAWVGKARTVGTLGLDAHGFRECSGAGLCNRAQGECACSPGHDGAACERVSCPSGARSTLACSGHGRCLSLRDLGRSFGLDSAPGVRGDGVGPNYGDASPAPWDADVIHACKCDGGYGGADCAQLLCPKGPNPFTKGQVLRVVRFYVNLNGVSVTSGQNQNVYLRFLGAETDGLDIGTLAALTAEQCGSWAATHPFIRSALCRKTVSGSDSYALELRLRWENRRRPQNNLFDHDGNPSLALFNCDGRDVASAAVTCSVADVDTAGSMTYAANGDSGSAVVVEVVSDTSVPNTYRVTVGTTAFAAAPMSSTPAAVGSLPNARISWSQTWGHTAGARWTISSSNQLSRPEPDEHRECGGIGRCDMFLGTCTCPPGASGVACSTETLAAAAVANNAPVSVLTAEAASYSGDVLRLRTTRKASSSFNFLSAVEGANAPLLTVSGTGTMRAKRVQADLGATVLSGGLFVGGGGATVLSGGLSVGAGTASVKSPAFDADVAAFHASSALFQNSVLKLTADRGASDQFRVLDAVVDADGTPARLLHLLGNGQLEVVKGLLKVSSAEGMHLAGSGGLLVTQAGATLQGGLLAETASATATAAEVAASSATYTGSMLSVRATRAASSAFKFLQVTASGSSQPALTHFGDGLVRVHRGGADISGGLTVTTGGVQVASGTTTAGAGLVVAAGGATVTAGGLAVADGGAALTHAGTATAHTLRSSSTALTSSHAVLRVESDTKSTVSADHSLLWAGSRDGANAMTERLKLTAAGVLSVSGHMVLTAKRPTLVASGATSLTLTESQCGSVVAAGSSTGSGVIAVGLPAQSGTATAGCFVTVVVVDATREIHVRNSQLTGSLYGKWLYHNGATVVQGSVSTTNFLTSGAGTGSALRVQAGASSLHAVVTMTAIPQLGAGANQWYVTSASGPWALTTF